MYGTAKYQIRLWELTVPSQTNSRSKDCVRYSEVPDQPARICCFFIDTFFRIQRPCEKQQAPDQSMGTGCFIIDTFLRIKRLCEQTASPRSPFGNGRFITDTFFKIQRLIEQTAKSLTSMWELAFFFHRYILQDPKIMWEITKVPDLPVGTACSDIFFGIWRLCEQTIKSWISLWE